jgi:DNA-binding NarL/FixJ family response regulator
MPSAQQSRSSAISVFIAESDHMNCQLVESIFRPKRARVKVVASAVDSNRALALVKETKPDIAVISAKLREGPLEGYRLLRALRSLQFKTRAIMLLDSREPDSVIDAFRCGAHGVVFRDEPLEILGKCIHAVHEGQVWAHAAAGREWHRATFKARRGCRPTPGARPHEQRHFRQAWT